MATSKLLYVTECPICTEVIVDSKVLPCIHTFCLKCLEQFWKDKKPGNQVPCPLCRTPFNISDRGFSDLPKNHFVEKLLDADKLSNTIQSIPTCDICSEVRIEEEEAPPPAAKHCFDCEKNICEQCARQHSVLKILKVHRVVPLGGNNSTIDTSMKHCDQHKDEKIKMYCLDCKTAVCQTCFIIKHNGHKCSDINGVTQGLKDQIRKDIELTNEIFLKVKEQSGNLATTLKDFEYNTKEIEDQIVRRGDEIKQLVDKHVQSLLQELKEEKTRKIKEFENLKEELQVQQISLESFMKYSQAVLDKATPSDIACFATEMKTRANNLTKMTIVPVGKRDKISFFPSDLELFTDGSSARNIVGETSLRRPIRIKRNMYAYIGKMNFLGYAVNEIITIIVLGSWNIGEEIYAFWQWTKDARGCEKSHRTEDGHLDSVEVMDGGNLKLKFFAGKYYTFVGTVTSDRRTLNLTMYHGAAPNAAKPITLQLQYCIQI